jgi:hypothetical protein
MKSKFASVLAVLFFAYLVAGCASSRYGSSEFTAAGCVNTSELIARKNTSGGRVRFFWGLFTIADD